MSPFLDPATIAAFHDDGAVVIRGVFGDWIDELAAGIVRNEAEPSEFFSENVREGEPGRFWDDYCNWQRIPEFERFIRESKVALIAGELMQSEIVQFFHDHVLVKDGGTDTPTPWHSDSPYYFVEGMQTVSVWLPLDQVDHATLRLIKGSHRWDRDVLPVRWLAGDDFYPDVDEYLPVPDPDANPGKFEVLEWALNRVMQWRFTTAPCTGPEVPLLEAPSDARSQPDSLVMMPATSPDPDRHRHHSRAMRCRTASDYASTGSRFSLAPICERRTEHVQRL